MTSATLCDNNRRVVRAAGFTKKSEARYRRSLRGRELAVWYASEQSSYGEPVQEATAAEVALRQATALLEVGRWEDAARRLIDLLGQHPDHLEALCWLAYCHRRCHRPVLAVQLADRAIGIDPGREWPYRLRAYALIDLRRPGFAVQAADVAVRLAPDSSAAHFTLADSLLALGGTRAIVRARHHADRVLSLAPEHSDSHALVGLADMRMARFSAARRAFERALALDPENQEARHNLAALDLALSRVGAAARGFDDAIALAPNDAETARAHRLGLRAWLWWRFDVLCLVGLAATIVAAVVNAALGGIPWPVGAAVAAVALAGYGWYLGRSVAVLSRGARLSLRRQLLRRPAFAAAPLCIAAVAGSMIVALTVQPAEGSIPYAVVSALLGPPAIVFVVRLRIRVLRRVYLFLRRLWFNLWSRPLRGG